MARRTHSTEKRKEFTMFEQEEMIENVEPTTEEAEVQVEQDEEEVIADESAKVYTEEDFRIYKEEHDRRLDKKVSRAEAKIRKEYERKYGNLENVLRAGSGRETVEEMTDAFAEHYKKQGINIPEQPQYNANDIKVLARAEADEIIGMGFDEVVEEVDRLAKIGVANMNDRDKEVFRTLAEYRQKEERNTEFEKLGVTKEVYTSQEFKDFASKFTKDTPVNEIINIFNSMKPRKEVQTAGSMKTNRTDQVKDYYTEADIERLTLDDLDKPGVWEAVRRSMTGGR
jgi:hypothetical protein